MRRIGKLSAYFPGGAKTFRGDDLYRRTQLPGIRSRTDARDVVRITTALVSTTSISDDRKRFTLHGENVYAAAIRCLDSGYFDDAETSRGC